MPVSVAVSSWPPVIGKAIPFLPAFAGFRGLTATPAPESALATPFFSASDVSPPDSAAASAREGPTATRASSASPIAVPSNAAGGPAAAGRALAFVLDIGKPPGYRGSL